MADVNITFEQFDVNDKDDIHLRWTKWITRLKRYLTHTKASSDDVKKNALLMFAGYDLEQVFDEKTLEADTFDEALKKLDTHFNPGTSQHLNRYNFRAIVQRDQESFDEFVTRLKLASKMCNFKEDDEMITQIISSCLSDSLKRKALAKTSLDLATLIELGRSDDVIKTQISGFKAAQSSDNADLFNVNTDRQSQSRQQTRYHRSPPPPAYHHRQSSYANSNNHQSNYRPSTKFGNGQPNKPCQYCGLQHVNGVCTARGVSCTYCGRKNHLESVCHQKIRRNQPQQSHYPAQVSNIQTSGYPDYVSDQDMQGGWCNSIKAYVNVATTSLKNVFMQKLSNLIIIFKL